ncbi:MAG TPA: hypothetical protein PKB06_08225 [Actinotalea sp.]|nr:hypothetical protein [Actinotalea sp.]
MSEQRILFPDGPSGPAAVDRHRATAWTVVTVVICAAMVLLGAGLIPLALEPGTVVDLGGARSSVPELRSPSGP